MKKYRLYLEGVKEVAEIWESDGIHVNAESMITEVCSELRDIKDCLFHIQEIIDFFSVNDPDSIKIIEVPVSNDYIRFFTCDEAVQMVQKLKNLR